MPEPSEKFHWATTAIPGVDIVEPPDNKKDIGWLSQEKPPYQYFNWLFNILGQWLDYVEEIGDNVVQDIKAVIPIGGVIGFADYGLVTFDTDVFAYLDGGTYADPDSPFDGQQREDASGRYLVGFGTDGGGDIGGGAFSILPVGAIAHQINIQHSHTVNAHSHTVNAHSHTVNAHNHSIGIHSHQVSITTTSIGQNPGAGSRFQLDEIANDLVVDLGATDKGNHTHDTIGDTDNTNLGNTGNSSPGTNASSPGTSDASPGTNNQLSTTQSIQPRSVPMRWIQRYK